MNAVPTVANHKALYLTEEDKAIWRKNYPGPSLAPRAIGMVRQCNDC